MFSFIKHIFNTFTSYFISLFHTSFINKYYMITYPQNKQLHHIHTYNIYCYHCQQNIIGITFCYRDQYFCSEKCRNFYL